MNGTRRRKLLSVVATSVCATGLVLGGAAAAQAASSHSISGTVYEDGTWFKSSTTRTVNSSNTDIVLSLTSVPTRGVEFRLWNAKNNSVFTEITTYTSPATKTLVTDVLSGTIFQNDFRKHDRTCTARCGDPSYGFSGNEVY